MNKNVPYYQTYTLLVLGKSFYGVREKVHSIQSFQKTGNILASLITNVSRVGKLVIY